MPLTVEQEEGLVGLVREVAAREILPRFRNLATGDIENKTGPDDPVTVADLAAERALTEGIARLLPEASVVGEEGVAADPSRLAELGRPGLTVVLDPVDGTWNFAHGLAVFGVILAVLEDGGTIFGLLYDPVTDDWVLTRRGGGTWFCRPGDEPRQLSIDAGRRSGLGFLPLYMFPQAVRPTVAARMAEGPRTTSLRCSCHEYRMLVLGAADYVLSLDLKPWDHAAGVLAVEEAGGAVRLSDEIGYTAAKGGAIMVAAASVEEAEVQLARYEGAARG